MNSQRFGGHRALVAAAAALVLLASAPALAVDFGDDSGDWPNDGECDDPRFAGPGLSTITLDNSDMFRDATDCQTEYDAGRVVLDASIGFGDDSSTWANDGECDDPRFEGSAMAMSPTADNEGRDATDCRAAFNRGDISLKTVAGAGKTGPVVAVHVENIVFGEDTSTWANDGECDDPRFEGPGVAGVLQDDDLRADATDCRQAYEAGRVNIAFGDDSSDFSLDAECDDARFSGPGMAPGTPLESDNLRDATDCRQGFEAGRLTLE